MRTPEFFPIRLSSAASGNAIAIGAGAATSSTLSDGIAIGAFSDAGFAATATGTFAQATGSTSSAFGYNARATADSSTALGRSALASVTGSTAVGAAAQSTVQNGTALGQGAIVTAAGAVALGSNSGADRENTVSVGGSQVNGISARSSTSPPARKHSMPSISAN